MRSLHRAGARDGRLYQQNHCGMYRSDDGGESWQSIEAGLPSSFGFPVAVHPRDPDTLFFAPLNGAELGRYPPDAEAAVWKSGDGGAHWSDKREGLPQQGAYFGIMRQAMATDALEPAGVYLGASNGSIFASRDEGETWTRIVSDLPAISSVETLVYRMSVLVRLPALLMQLFPDAERVVSLEVDSVDALIDCARRALAGHARSPLRHEPVDPASHQCVRRRQAGEASNRVDARRRRVHPDGGERRLAAPAALTRRPFPDFAREGARLKSTSRVNGI